MDPNGQVITSDIFVSFFFLAEFNHVTQVQYLPKVFGSPRGPYAKTLFFQSSKCYSFQPNSFKFCMYIEVARGIHRGSKNTSDFSDFNFNFPKYF
jgi:hypothetical protein